MNYRHAFHAGNFADVFKHALLARILTHLNAKDTPWLYLDTHAGLGVYDLEANEALRTKEAQEGIAKILTADLPDDVRLLLQPYFASLTQVQDEHATFYPGSPEVARHLARATDRLVLCELHPDDARGLRQNLAMDSRCTVVESDGWKVLKAQVPPRERRGMVLVDPPFEEVDEFDRLASSITAAYRKWATGIYAIWYPIKGLQKASRLAEAFEAAGIPKILRLELLIDDASDESKLAGCGMIIVNPPWKLKTEAEILLPQFARLMGRSNHGAWRANWLATE